MLIQLQLMLTYYVGNKSHLSLSQQPLIGHKVRPTKAKDSPKRPRTEGIKSLSQIPGQSPSLTSIEQDCKHQGTEDLDFHPSPDSTTSCTSRRHLHPSLTTSCTGTDSATTPILLAPTPHPPT